MDIAPLVPIEISYHEANGLRIIVNQARKLAAVTNPNNPAWQKYCDHFAALLDERINALVMAGTDKPVAAL